MYCAPSGQRMGADVLHDGGEGLTVQVQPVAVLAGLRQISVGAHDALPAVEETEYLRHVRFDRELEICIDGRSSKAIIK